MKLFDYLKVQNEYYGEDWCDNTISGLIHISGYTPKKEVKYDCQRLENLLIENVEIENSNTLKMYEFIETHIEELNKVEGYSGMEVWDWFDEMNLLISGNVGDNLTKQVYETLKRSIKQQPKIVTIYRAMYGDAILLDLDNKLLKCVDDTGTSYKQLKQEEYRELVKLYILEQLDLEKPNKAGINLEEVIYNYVQEILENGEVK